MMECSINGPAGPEDEAFIKPFTRAGAAYSNQSEAYRTPSMTRYGAQYSQLYYTRFHLMKQRLLLAAKNKWGDGANIKELKDVMKNEDCCIVGTIFKRMKLQPSILKEISDNHAMVTHPPRTKYISEDDEILLEDLAHRVTLTGNMDGDTVATGVLVAVRGREENNGKFNVIDYCFAGAPPIAPPSQISNNDDIYVLLVSGLNIGSEWSDQLFIQLLVDYINGQLGHSKDQSFISNIVRVVIAGNSITNQPIGLKEKENKTRYTSKNYSADSVEAMNELDQVMSELATSVSVDIMPGAHDPANNQLPKQPLHHCMFPLSSSLPTLNNVTNPYQFTVNGVKFLGTCGENIDNLYSYTNGLDTIDLLEKTLTWSHLAPTAPDTLSCHPFTDKDPFIIDESPHVYFTGNQPSYQWKQSDNGTLLISVPIFDDDHSCVLVNLSSLTCQELNFSTSLATMCNPSRDKHEQLINDVTRQLVMNDIVDSDDNDM